MTAKTLSPHLLVRRYSRLSAVRPSVIAEDGRANARKLSAQLSGRETPTRGLGNLLEAQGVYTPLPRHSSESVDTSVSEAQPRADGEIVHRARYKDLPTDCHRADPSCDVHGDTCDIIVEQLAFARVQPRPHVETKPGKRLDDLLRAANGARGAVKGGNESVPYRPDLASPPTLELVSYYFVVAVK